MPNTAKAMNPEVRSDDVILEMKNITKTFPGVKALSEVNFRLKAGTIHAICGENGAGKSTLIKILSGIYPTGTYTGEIITNGEIANFTSVKDAEQAGIVCIHQELVLVPELTVAENIFLGHQPSRRGVIDTARLYQLTKELLVRVGINTEGKPEEIQADDIISNLSVGKQQLVEIAKALSKDCSILILDEPTSALTESESAVLLDILRSLREKGLASIYISHKLDEVMAIADDVTMIRDGVSIASKCIDETSKAEIIRNMVGRELVNQFPEADHTKGEVRFSVRNYNIFKVGSRTRKLIDDISFEAKEGEVLGVSGLMGSGRTELFSSICGILPNRKEGEVYLDGKKLNINSAKDAISHGIYYLTEDRNRFGLVLNMSVRENITLSSLRKIARMGVIDRDKEETYVTDYVKKINIKTPSNSVKVSTLSGGNRQKVAIAKSLLTEPKVLILDEPTRGIDVGAKYEIYSIIHQLVDQGVVVIVISSELEEVLGLSDRVLVFAEGKLSGELDINEADQVSIMKMATGVETDD
ncbi:MAG: sugar ABC transporter ATP-binding protein [Fastidiosipilaceae bacterium]|jgi:D-xylose transport system ATP-binding protein